MARTEEELAHIQALGQQLMDLVGEIAELVGPVVTADWLRLASQGLLVLDAFGEKEEPPGGQV